MKYALLVALREFAEHTKTKGFWIGIFLFPVLAFAGVKVPMLLKDVTPTRYFAVADPSGKFTPIIDAAVQEEHERKIEDARDEWEKRKSKDPETADFEVPRPPYQRVPLPAGAPTDPVDELTAALKPWLVGDRKIELDGREEELFALVVLPQDEKRLRSATEYWCSNLADDGLRKLVEASLRDDLRRQQFLSAGVDADDIERIDKLAVHLSEKDPTKAAGEEAVDLMAKARQWAPIGFVYVMFVAILTVAQMLISSTIEEKSNRIVEVLLSSVTPGELMLGKLLGVAAVGVTMLLAWIGSILLVVRWFAGAEVSAGVLGILTDFSLLGPFFVYFGLGYMLYASILLACGSLCNTLKDAQNFMGPVMMVLMVPILTMTFVAKDPHGPLAVILSWIPPFTPFVMMNRAAADPPTFDLVGTGVLLLVSIAFTIWFSGRIFRNGILRTGQPPKLLELWKLVRA